MEELLIKQLKEHALRLGVEGVLDYLIGHLKLKFIALPIINPVVRLVVSFILEVALDKTELGAFIVVTHWRTGEQADRFKDAATQIAQLPEGASDEERQKAEQELIDSARSLIKFTR